MKKHQKILILILSLLSTISWSQNNELDSLEKEFLSIYKTNKEATIYNLNARKELVYKKDADIQKRIKYFYSLIDFNSFYTSPDSIIINNIDSVLHYAALNNDSAAFFKGYFCYGVIKTYKLNYLDSLEKAIPYANANKNPKKSLYHLYLFKQKIYAFNGRNKKSMNALTKAFSYIDTTDKIQMKQYHLACFYASYSSGMTELANDNLSKMYDWAWKNKDTNLLYTSKSYRTTLLTKQKKYKSALIQCHEIMKSDFMANNTTIYFNQFIKMSNIFYELKDYDSAIYYNKKAVDFYKNKNYKQFKVHLKYNLTEIYLKQKKYDLAIKQVNEGLSLAIKKNNFREIAKGYEIKATILNQSNENNKALIIFDSAVKYNKIANPNASISLNDLAISINEGLGKYQTALNYSKINTIIKDSLAKEETKIKIEESELKLNNKILNQENQLLQEKEVTSMLNLSIVKKENLQQFLISIILILILLFSFIFFYSYRKKNKKLQTILKEKLELNKQQSRLLSDKLTERKKEIKKLKSLEQVKLNKATIISDLKKDNNWIDYYIHFENTFKIEINEVLKKHPQISQTDLRLITLIMFDLSNKECAIILNITENGIKKGKQRIRKKLNIPESIKTSSFLHKSIL